MSIAVVCSHCSAKLNAPDSAAGKKVKCPKCQSVITVPEALAPEFEVVEDEPQAPKKPKAVVKAAVELDDDDEPPRKKRRARDEDDDDQDDDDRPRKKKKKPAEGNSMMVRNIVGGVALIALLVVAGFVFADRFKKKDESGGGGSGGSDDAKPANPKIVGGAPQLKPFAAGAGGAPGAGGGQGAVAPVGRSVWNPDPNLLKDLTQKCEIAGYQISLPEMFTPAMLPMAPPNTDVASWVINSATGTTPAGISIVIEKGAGTVDAFRKDPMQLLILGSEAFANAIKGKGKVTSHGSMEDGQINGLSFKRISFSGVAANQVQIQGFIYGATEGDLTIGIIAMRFSAAQTEMKLLESAIATFKKK